MYCKCRAEMLLVPCHCWNFSAARGPFALFLFARVIFFFLFWNWIVRRGFSKFAQVNWSKQTCPRVCGEWLAPYLYSFNACREVKGKRIFQKVQSQKSISLYKKIYKNMCFSVNFRPAMSLLGTESASWAHDGDWTKSTFNACLSSDLWWLTSFSCHVVLCRGKSKSKQISSNLSQKYIYRLKQITDRLQVYECSICTWLPATTGDAVS